MAGELKSHILVCGFAGADLQEIGMVAAIHHGHAGRTGGVERQTAVEGANPAVGPVGVNAVAVSAEDQGFAAEVGGLFVALSQYGIYDDGAGRTTAAGEGTGDFPLAGNLGSIADGGVDGVNGTGGCAAARSHLWLSRCCGEIDRLRVLAWKMNGGYFAGSVERGVGRTCVVVIQLPQRMRLESFSKSVAVDMIVAIVIGDADGGEGL